MTDSDPNSDTQDVGSGRDVPIEPTSPDSPGAQPARIGRYRIDDVLGKGGFGIVYLAYDEQLHRPVAVKVPHATVVSRIADARAYLTEARTVAGLDHPNIVPVYDVGNTDTFPCYVVSKFIRGRNLRSRLRQQRFEFRESAELVATVAEALHYAHTQGLVHRDIVISDSRPFRIVPKGLRSFDQRDSDFFLDLLPGARDRDGMPDSLRFWKTRIEETDSDNAFSVGLIYGPSGCGKSSLVKAGLLPRLRKTWCLSTSKHLRRKRNPAFCTRCENAVRHCRET